MPGSHLLIRRVESRKTGDTAKLIRVGFVDENLIDELFMTVKTSVVQIQ